MQNIEVEFMNEFVFLAIAVISGIFGLISIQMLQQNWYKREDLKYKFDVKRARMRRKNIPIKQTSTPTSPTDWIDTIKKLNPDILHGLIDSVTDNKSVEGDFEESEGIEGTIMNIARNNPELVQNFLNGLQQGKTGQKGEIVR